MISALWRATPPLLRIVLAAHVVYAAVLAAWLVTA